MVSTGRIEPLRFFFFQAEDGIRDGTVTGVQTCALPIWLSSCSDGSAPAPAPHPKPASDNTQPGASSAAPAMTPAWQQLGNFDSVQGQTRSARSEERRVGKECSCEASAYDEKTTTWLHQA